MSPDPQLHGPRPPFPPFTHATALQKVTAAEDAWNTRDPSLVAMAYSPDSHWRVRTELVTGRDAIVRFLNRKWAHERDYRLVKELWAFGDARIAVRFAYEFHAEGRWHRAYGNENWEFDEYGLMRRRYACINDHSITEPERDFRWPSGPRPAGHPGLRELGL